MCYNFKNVSTCDNNVLSEFNNLIIHWNRFLCELINPFHPNKGFAIDE